MNLNNHTENILVYIFFGVFLYLGYGAINTTEIPNEKLLEIHYLDVGQGDATLLKTPEDEYILIDGGPDKSVLTELGKILPAYNKNIQAVFLSHPHADHLSGLNYILDRYTVNEIFITGASHNTPDFLTFLEKIKENKIQTEMFLAGDRKCFDVLCVESYWPHENEVSKYELNDTSMILNVIYGSNNFLFLGDLSFEVQETILNDINLDIEVLKVSHHGSKTGTSKKTIWEISPKIAVISVGEENYFGHPAQSVLRLLSNQTILRTDLLGTITIQSDGNTVHY